MCSCRRSRQFLLGVRADGNWADRECRPGLENRADPLDLFVELLTLAAGQGAQRLDGDGHLGAGLLLVPDTGDDTVDEEYREIAGLAPGERPIPRRAGEQQFAR